MKGQTSKASLFLKRHSPIILTCAGAVGVIATAVTAVRATPKAMKLLEASEKQKGEKLTKLEVLKVAGPAYIPSAIIGVSTIGCIFGANALNKKQQAALTSAYALLDSSYKEYRKAVDSTFENGDQQVIETMAASRQEDDGKILVFDNLTLQFFRVRLEDVQAAKDHINKLYRERGYACLQEFYEMMGIDYLDPNYTKGWSSMDGQYLYNRDSIEIRCEPTIDEHGNPNVYILSMPWEPTDDYLL
jgi:hypothetical protein